MPSKVDERTTNRGTIISNGGAGDPSKSPSYEIFALTNNANEASRYANAQNNKHCSDDEDVDDRWNCWRSTARKCLAEFLGDFFLVFIGSLSFTIDNVGPMGAAFAHGFTIALLIISLGHVSGGHFNPAVTLGVCISGNIHPILAAFYVCAQILGAIVGGFALRGVLTEAAYCHISGGTTNPNVIYSEMGNIFVLEIILSYLLVQTVLNGAVELDGSNVLAPLAIGLTILVDILAGGDKSGASMNCARSFGPAVSYSILYPGNCTLTYKKMDHCNDGHCSDVGIADVWAYHWIAWAGPLLGGTIAGVVYRLFLTKKARKCFRISD